MNRRVVTRGGKRNKGCLKTTTNTQGEWGIPKYKEKKKEEMRKEELRK